MTFEEAKKILEKEGYCLIKVSKGFEFSELPVMKKQEVIEATRVVNENSFAVSMTETERIDRQERLKKEREKNTKTLGPGEEQAKKGNPALKEAASQFNDALLDEQAKEIESLRDKCKKYAYVLDSVEAKLRKLKAENSRIKNSDLNLEGLIYATRELEEKNKKIEELTKEKTNLEDQITILNACKEYNEDFGRKQIKRLGKEIAKLNSIIHDKNAVLSDVAEELRLTKIREKNLAELGLKYVGENEKLKKELADKVVDKIDAQALKSAESALAYKDEVIETLDKELAEAKHELSSLKRPFRPDSTEAVVLFANAYAKAERKQLPCTDWRNDGKEVSATYILENGKKSKIALDFTGDEIIFSRTDPDKPRKDSLYSYKDKQLAEKDEVIADLCNELAATKKELEEKTHLVEIVRNDSKDYCDYGVAANEFIKKLANLYVIAGSKGTISNKMFERCKNYQSYGFPAKFRVETKKEIDSIARGKENKKK